MMWLGGRCVCDMWLGMYYVNVYTTKTKIDLTKNKVNEKEQRENREKAKNSSNQTKYVDYIIQYMTLYYGSLIGQHINFYFLIFIFCPRFAPLFENYYNKYSMLCVRVGFVLSYFAIFMFVFRLSQRQWNERTKKTSTKSYVFAKRYTVTATKTHTYVNMRGMLFHCCDGGKAFTCPSNETEVKFIFATIILFSFSVEYELSQKRWMFLSVHIEKLKICLATYVPATYIEYKGQQHHWQS